jgi:triosephosphate isomerase
VAAKKPLVAGNWKMNGFGASLAELKALKERLAQAQVPEAEAMICPPATLLAQARWALTGSVILLGAQDCHPLPSGAHTGDISAEMLADAGASAVIVGHSERRTDHGETDALVNVKARAAFLAGLTAISASAKPSGKETTVQPWMSSGVNSKDRCRKRPAPPTR